MSFRDKLLNKFQSEFSLFRTIIFYSLRESPGNTFTDHVFLAFFVQLEDFNVACTNIYANDILAGNEEFGQNIKKAIDAGRHFETSLEGARKNFAFLFLRFIHLTNFNDAKIGCQGN